MQTHILSTGVNFDQIYQALAMSEHEQVQDVFQVSDLDSIALDAASSVQKCLVSKDNACVFHKQNETYIVFYGNKNFILIKVESQSPHLLKQMVDLPCYM